MALDREQSERRIYEILRYINDQELISLIKQNINLFSTDELNMIVDFLESWEIPPLYKLMLWKIQEYRTLLSELRNKNLVNAKNKKLEEEKQEKIEEEKELDNILKF